MNNTVIDVDANSIPNVEANTERTYTAVEIAEANSVTDATIRNGWFKWISQVAPEEVLKDGKRFTHLAFTLYKEFANVPAGERKQWVQKKKTQCAEKLGKTSVIEGEVMPSEVGGTLALMQAGNIALEYSNEVDLDQALRFIDDLNEADVSLSAQQVQQYMANGQRAAIAQFTIEEKAKQQTLNQLRQRRIGGGEQS